jgi:membrane-bound lytic murein transglycosylase B
VPTTTRRHLPRFAVAAVAVALAGPVSSCDGSPGSSRQAGGPPPPNEPIPREAASLAEKLATATVALEQSIDAWLADREARGGDTPSEVTLRALYQQRLYLFLTDRPRLAGRVLSRLPAEVAAEARDILAARRALRRLTPPTRRRRFRTGRSLPAAVLLRHYLEAQRRFGVSWPVLAAVNLVETSFNKLRSNSTAGAQGPMQFIPSTWRAYGMGGDVRDPHDAILGAANYLRHSGAPGDYRRALYAYNPTLDYVDAVLRFVRRIRRDRRAYYAFHAWQVFVRTPAGLRRLTGP